MEVRGKAEKIYKNTRKLIISCCDHDGYPYTKVVLPTCLRDSIETIYIATNTSSKFVENIKINSKANVYFYDGIFYKGCMLKGNMSICDDMSLKKKLWSNAYKGAYPLGVPEDPDYCVLIFKALSGRYYSMYKTYDFEV